MNRRQIGALVVIAGGVMMFAGGLLTMISGSGGSDTPVAVAAPASTTTTSTAPSTTAPPTTDAPSTTTASTIAEPTTTTSTTTTAVTTTTVQATTTTTVAPTVLVEEFIVAFAAALEEGDSEYVLSRLHPALMLGFGEALCEGWVEREIMALGDYSQAGPVTGPTTGSLETPGGTIVFDERYTVDITFTFSGTTISSAADYVLVDGVVYFTGTCR